MYSSIISLAEIGNCLSRTCWQIYMLLCVGIYYKFKRNNGFSTVCHFSCHSCSLPVCPYQSCICVILDPFDFSTSPLLKTSLTTESLRRNNISWFRGNSAITTFIWAVGFIFDLFIVLPVANKYSWVDLHSINVFKTVIYTSNYRWLHNMVEAHALAVGVLLRIELQIYSLRKVWLLKEKRSCCA